MPFSESSLLSPVVGCIEKLQPKSVMDVGVGFGQYGFLCRTNLEHINLFDWSDSHARKRDKSEWQIRIDGIEAFPDYITPVHDYAYNEILIGNALQILQGVNRKYDLVLAIEILEHLEKEDGLMFLQLLESICGGTILLTTPKEFIVQEYPANPYENHRSFWTPDDLKSIGFQEIMEDDTSWIAMRRP